MNLDFRTNPTMEVEAQRLAQQLQANPEAAVNQLRNDLYSGNLPACNVQEMVNEANRLAGPYSNHLMVTSTSDGRVDVDVAAANPSYCESPAPYYQTPYYSTPRFGIGNPGVELPGVRINIPLPNSRWRR
jgi:hypothetical protein